MVQIKDLLGEKVGIAQICFLHSVVFSLRRGLPFMFHLSYQNGFTMLKCKVLMVILTLSSKRPPGETN